ncbi:PTS fructose transporter subunit IIABC [Anaerosacchariphilus polymeriproducens]|uniref:PTS fructose transporter subunit IIC n=1 Tax=Anaerosacchariphilus polymeriproducens TaxID=1812858 RepID=A0A371AZV2_9FIRM|nr:fructose-specific PTS transporter subunit EIIC [Anaerosacchariphilus polymeriproducens]RDU25138.1 PTS fructose transporter subunit IIC [Anaerosacchariphilus polymeriproducens]
MKITDLLVKTGIDLDGKASSKKDAIEKMVDLMVKTGKINNPEVYKAGVFAREEEGTTGIGEGIAIPHCKSDAVNAPGLACMVLKDGVDYDSLDGQPVHLIFLIAAPDTEENVHLDVLSRLSVLLMDETFTSNLRNAKTVEEFLSVIDKAESAKMQREGGTNMSKGLKLLAVTACPTGIAHTYMAAENLDKKARAAGHSIKVETRGSGGAKNVLTNQEIAEADCIIIAADTKVPMERFDGKKVIQRQVSDGIGKADELIALAESGNVPIYHSTGTEKTSSSNTSSGSIGHQIYKHLMSGVSHMLPFVVGGGILIAIAFLIDSRLVDLKTVEDLSKFGTITPVAAFFKSIGGGAFGFMLPILAGYIAMSIADRPGLAVGFVGGLIASSGTVLAAVPGLKTGNSGFLGALVAGFLAGYVVLLLKKVFSVLPESLEGIKPVLLYPLFGILIVGCIMVFIVEPPVGLLNLTMNNGLKSMSGSGKILLGLIVGGMMSVDMGGPVNKAAYVFGTASITSGNFDIMAAVMVGGMVPPLACSLATFLFKNKFTDEERKAGPTNIVMGLSFISEGAIPFAAADPIRVIIPCIIGSAASGALSMLFNCTLMAPHGGIFVFPLVGNALMYIVSLLIGTAVAGVLMGLIKKPIEQ